MRIYLDKNEYYENENLIAMVTSAMDYEVNEGVGETIIISTNEADDFASELTELGIWHEVNEI